MGRVIETPSDGAIEPSSLLLFHPFALQAVAVNSPAVPRSSAWRALVDARRSLTYEQFASARGLARHVYRAGVDVRVQQWVGQREVRVRVRPDVLPLILGDGRLKTQFE